MTTPQEADMQEALTEFLKLYIKSGEGKTAQAVAFQVARKDGTRGTVHCLVLADSLEDSALGLERIQYGPRVADGKNAHDRTIGKWADSWLAKNGL